MKRLGLLLYFTLCFLLLFTTSAYAYIDPSVMTYTIQVIAGVAVAVGAFFAIYWRRAKKKVKDTLGIDVDANKEQEEDIVVYTKEDNNQNQG